MEMFHCVNVHEHVIGQEKKKQGRIGEKEKDAKDIFGRNQMSRGPSCIHFALHFCTYPHTVALGSTSPDTTKTQHCRNKILLLLCVQNAPTSQQAILTSN